MRIGVAVGVGLLVLAGTCFAGAWYVPDETPAAETVVARVLTLGDSNGQGEGKWPDRLAALLNEGRTAGRVAVWNDSLSGRTFGFLYRDRPVTRAVTVIGAALAEAETRLGGPVDEVVLCLGTNDVKDAYACQGKTVEDALAAAAAVLDRIGARNPRPRATVLSPPAIGAVVETAERTEWRHARPRLAAFVAGLGDLCRARGVRFVDAHTPTRLAADAVLGRDGVHLRPEGHTMMARLAGEMRVLAIGDSNGAGQGKWPDRLEEALAAAIPTRRVRVHNASRSGRAIGFRKFGPDSCALLVLDGLLAEGRAALSGPVEEVVVGLGTNDAQNRWAERGRTVEDVAVYLDVLIDRLRVFRPHGERGPRVTVLAPPPLGSMMATDAPTDPTPAGRHQAKWQGARPRMARLASAFEAVARRKGGRFVDVYATLAPEADRWLTEDGVHLAPEGHRRVAALVAEAMVGDH